MLIGIIGAPNKGKTTLFSAITGVEARIENRPFTTIEPNKGRGYVKKRCVESELGVKCNPKDSKCINGIRHIPIDFVDVAGLIPGSHMGKGMGNQFLNDLSSADALIQVIDITGKTDLYGNPSTSFDPCEEVKAVRREVVKWLAEIVKKHMAKACRSKDPEEALANALSSFRAKKSDILAAEEKMNVPGLSATWGDEEIERLSEEILIHTKKLVVAANKIDACEDYKEKVERLKECAAPVVPCSAEIELAIQRIVSRGLCEFSSNRLVPKQALPQAQMEALDRLNEFLSHSTTGIDELIYTTVFESLKCIAVYPVENERSFSDKNGNVLPNLFLMREGDTALDLAYKIHTEIGEHMLYGIDAKKKERVGKGYLLKDNDVIKIVSASKKS
ncbi:MAG: YchF-related putative GTPase [Candidatus Micrarchaeaceae archaeon]